MDQSTFTKLTGLTLSSSQSARLSSVAELAGEALEELLGWPLDPTSWENQYIEIGKSKDEWGCFSTDTSNLDPPDEVVGKTRLYKWNPHDQYLHIDPAKTIHALKIVRNGVTYKTFKTSEYSLKMENGLPPFGKYIQIGHEFRAWLGYFWPQPFLFFPYDQRRHDAHYLQVAVDADWSFDDLPTKLQKVQADLIYYELDMRRDFKSETMLSHSYSRNPHPDPTTVHAATLAKYLGPNGTAQRAGVTR